MNTTIGIIKKTKTESSSVISRFENPIEWTENWHKEHKTHSVVSINHTVFVDTIGTVYKEYRCYNCSCCARESIGKIKSAIEKIELPQRKIRRGTSVLGKMGGSGRAKEASKSDSNSSSTNVCWNAKPKTKKIAK